MPLQSPRSKPSAYPPLAFHALRTVQLVSSLIVVSITIYFLRELRRDGYSLPWTFILLLTASLLTLLALAFTLFLHLRVGLSPRISLALHGALAALWSVSFALLGWWSSGALRSSCGREGWETQTGASVCRMYKALFSFALLGTAGTLAAVGLDAGVVKRTGGRGRFVSLARGGDGGDGGMWDANAPAELSGGRGREGYAVPEGQWGYDDHEADTRYGGAGEAVGRRSVERRT